MTIAERLNAGLGRLEKHITAYDLFAIGVVAMGLGRLASTFEIDSDLLKIPLRALMPVFMVLIGYNVGRRFIDWRILGCAVIIIVARALLFNVWFWPSLGHFPLNFLVTIVVTRAIIEPLMAFAMKTRVHFWLTVLALAAAAPWTHIHLMEYGTLGVLMAMCGWLARNRAQLPSGAVDVRDFFIIVLFFYLAFCQAIYAFSPPSFVAMAAGTALVFRFCYNFRVLLLASLKRKPKDLVERACYFMGRNSLEIYTLMVIVSYLAFYRAIA